MKIYFWQIRIYHVQCPLISLYFCEWICFQFVSYLSAIDCRKRAHLKGQTRSKGHFSSEAGEKMSVFVKQAKNQDKRYGSEVPKANDTSSQQQAKIQLHQKVPWQEEQEPEVRVRPGDQQAAGLLQKADREATNWAICHSHIWGAANSIQVRETLRTFLACQRYFPSGTRKQTLVTCTDSARRVSEGSRYRLTRTSTCIIFCLLVCLFIEVTGVVIEFYFICICYLFVCLSSKRQIMKFLAGSVRVQLLWWDCRQGGEH